MPGWSFDEEKLLRRMFSADDPTKELAEARTSELMELMVFYKCAMMEIETKFNVLNAEYSLMHDRNPIQSIKTRLKSPRSIRDKLIRRNLPVSVASIEENLTDIAGVRVICSFPDDVYALIRALLRQDDITLIDMKDYIANPKPNGYRSLHIIVEIPIFLEHGKKRVKVEIQLRTIAMDFWATLEHQLRYKKDFDFTDEMMRELKECAEVSAKLDRRMEAIRKAVLPGKIDYTALQDEMF